MQQSTTKKILVIGSGGREHAMALALKQSPLCGEILFAPGNPGMESIGQCVPVKASDVDGLVQLARREAVDLVVVGPEIPLVAGVVDALGVAGIPALGPTAAAARIEGSKAFSKDLMRKYGIPTAAYQTFQALDPALEYLAGHPAPIVVKASGLAAGKGAVVCMTDKEAVDAVTDMLGPHSVFGEAGREVVIEEFMEGEEASLFVLCDGRSHVVLATAQDHKRVGDGDQGPNTGGMGAYAPAPCVTPEILATVTRTVVEPTLAGMEQEGSPFCGFLYVGLMLTAQGPKVVEYNCRLGDPEAQVVLPLVDGDFLELCLAASQGQLGNSRVVPQKVGSAAVVVVCSQGYPGEYSSGHPISFEEIPADSWIVHAGTRRNASGVLETSGGRVLGAVGLGRSLRTAVDKAYAAAAGCHFEGCFYRKDIGHRGLARCLN